MAVVLSGVFNGLPAQSAAGVSQTKLLISGATPGSPLVGSGVLPFVKDGMLVLHIAEKKVTVSPWGSELPQSFVSGTARVERRLDPAGPSDTLVLQSDGPEMGYVMVMSGARSGSPLPGGARLMADVQPGHWHIELRSGEQRPISANTAVLLKDGSDCWRVHVRGFGGVPTESGAYLQPLPSVDAIAVSQACAGT